MHSCYTSMFYLPKYQDSNVPRCYSKSDFESFSGQLLAIVDFTHLYYSMQSAPGQRSHVGRIYRVRLQLGQIEVSAHSHHKQIAPELVCDQTETTSSNGSLYSCFDPHPSMIAMFGSAKKNHTTEENKPDFDATGLHGTVVLFVFTIWGVFSPVFQLNYK